MTSALPTNNASSSSSVPLMGNIGAIDGGGPNSASGGTIDSHSPAPSFSLELLATLLARTTNSMTAAGNGCAMPPPAVQPSFAASQTSLFTSSSDVPVIQQLLRATNPLLNNGAVVGDLMAPSALQALLVAGMAQHQQQQRRASMLIAKTEADEDELLAMEMKRGGTPSHADKMETNEDDFMQQNDAMFIKAELGTADHLQQQQQSPHNDEDEEGGAVEVKPNNAHQQQQGQPQRRQRVGGSSVKTAEVWRFFTQRPPPEQAATCQICQKTIKATNSSTTGMIRHLRSCHQSEFQQLQQARYLKNLKNDPAERQKVLLQLQLGIDPHSEASIDAIQAALESSFTSLQSPPPAMNGAGGVSTKHSVEALISGESPRSTSPNSTAQQRQLLEQIENFKTSRPTSMERSKKEGGGTDPTMVVVGKRGADEAASGVGDSADVPVSQMNTPLHGTATKRRKAMMGGASEEFCQRGKVPSPGTTAPGGPLTGDSQQTPRAGGKKNGGANGRRTANVAHAMPPPSTAETLAGRAKVVEQQQSERISDQIAAMLLVDQSEFLLERIGFRQFVQTLVPGYTMPSGGQFRAEIIPRVAKQLQQLALFREELQRNNPFGMPSIGMLLNNGIKPSMHFHHNQQQHSFSGGSPTALSTSSSSSSGTPSGGHVVATNQCSSSMTNLVSPSSSTEESGFHDEEQHNISAFGGSNVSGGSTSAAANGGGMALDELVQQAAFHSQNISRSFTFSIDLNSDGSAESVGMAPAGEKASAKEDDSDTASSI